MENANVYPLRLRPAGTELAVVHQLEHRHREMLLQEMDMGTMAFAPSAIFDQHNTNRTFCSAACGLNWKHLTKNSCRKCAVSFQVFVRQRRVSDSLESDSLHVVEET